MPAVDQLEVVVDTASPVRVGTARFTLRRGRVATSFSYDGDYLASPRAVKIDPHLELFSGSQYVDGFPGAFQDCSPDRWGRTLIEKRIRAAERLEGKTPQSVGDVDFLVEVTDATRQGALRFRSPDSPTFLSPSPNIPNLIALPRLVDAADRLSRDGDDQHAIQDLLEAGSGSLGGARPKASLIGDTGALLLAKFPHQHDEWDVMAWEKTALDLAERAGIATPSRRLVPVGDRSVLLLSRFDRTADGRRIPYVSAMTLTGSRDGDPHDYVDIAESITDHGAQTSRDLAELFRRAAFNCAIHNTDDHLRNVGFLGRGAGWALSPVFDINPDPDPATRRVTALGTAERLDEEPFGLAAMAAACRLPAVKMTAELSAVRDAIGHWRDAATRNGIRDGERSRFEESFRAGSNVLDTMLSG